MFSLIDKLERLLIEPRLIIQKTLKILPVSISKKIEWDAISRPNYAYGTYHAAMQAIAMGIDRISVIEFGVAGGNGLIALQEIAEAVSKDVGCKIDVYGFDSGSGMPPPVDYRDLPYIWQAGFYAMNVEKIKERLRDASLVIGNVSDTVTKFVVGHQPAPIGFISFDLDYYSSTAEAFQLFESDSAFFLPRVICYFDDIIGGDWQFHSKYTGELLAIDEFNQAHDDKKIAKIYGFSIKRKIHSAWNEQMFAFHNFSHPLYGKHILSESKLQPSQLI